MAISVQHGPSMVDYGAAIAKASQRQEAANRMQQYGAYLANLQKANQDYGLGLGELGVQQQRTGIEQQKVSKIDRELDLREFQNNLAAQQLQLQSRTQGLQSHSNYLNALANVDRGLSSILSAQSNYGYF